MCRCRLCGPQGKRVTARVFDEHTTYACADLLRTRPAPLAMYNAQTHSFRCFDSDSVGSDDGHGSVTDSDSERAWSTDDSDDRGSNFSEQPMAGDDGGDDGVAVEPVAIGAAAQRAPDEHSDFRFACVLHVPPHARSFRHYHHTWLRLCITH